AMDKTYKALWDDAQSSLDEYTNSMKAVASTLFFQMKAAGILGGVTSSSPLDYFKEKIADAKQKSKDWDDSIADVETESARASMQNAHDTEAENFEDVEVDSLKNEFASQYTEYQKAYEALIGSYGSINDINMCDPVELTDIFGYGNYFFEMPNDYIDELLGVWDSDADKSYSTNISSMTKSVKTNVNNDWSGFSSRINSGDNEKVIKLLKQISEKNIIQDKAAQEEKKEEGEKEKDNLEGDKNALEAKKEEELEKIKNIPESTNDMTDVTEIETFAQYAQRVDLDAPANCDEIKNSINFNSSGLITETEDEESGKKEYDTGGMQNLLGDFMSFVGQIAEGGRDNLFVTQYLADGFSCLTTGKKDGKDLESPQKNVAGLLLNEKSNKHFKSELEYIIYGQNTEVGNKGLAIASISGIRLVLNLIYSYTDSEITAFTSATAASITAIFPFAMPVVKTVLHILISAAETAYDIIQLTEGYSVPIYKTASTWMCKGSNIAGNILQKVAEKTIDSVSSELEKLACDFIDGSEEALTEWKSKMLTQKKEELVSELNNYILIPLQDFVLDTVAKCQGGTAELADEVGKKVDLIFEQMTNSADSSGGSGILGEALAGLVEKLDKESIKSKVVNLINEQTTAKLENFSEAFKNKMQDVTNKINSVVDSLDEKLNEVIDSAANEAKRLAVNGINTAGDKVMSTINSQISQKLSGTRNVNFGTGNTNVTVSKESSIVNMITMNYKDYLCVFLYIGMIGGSDAILMRAAQLMQCNINYINSSASYNMNTAVTMFNIDCGSRVKTSVIGRVADSNGVTLRNLSDGYYNIYVSSFAGY
ncbi:MAG: DUF5702 domain-containing protein, partial [Ruminiclostridium sp.]